MPERAAVEAVAVRSSSSSSSNQYTLLAAVSQPAEASQPVAVTQSAPTTPQHVRSSATGTAADAIAIEDDDELAAPDIA
eukprot:12099-Heterococcus_DN1.PRE.4